MENKNVIIAVLATSLIMISLLSIDIFRNNEKRLKAEIQMSLVESIIETKVENSRLNALLEDTEKDLRSAKYQLGKCRGK